MIPVLCIISDIINRSITDIIDGFENPDKASSGFIIPNIKNIKTTIIIRDEGLNFSEYNPHIRNSILKITMIS